MESFSNSISISFDIKQFLLNYYSLKTNEQKLKLRQLVLKLKYLTIIYSLLKHKEEKLRSEFIFNVFKSNFTLDQVEFQDSQIRAHLIKKMYNFLGLAVLGLSSDLKKWLFYKVTEVLICYQNPPQSDNWNQSFPQVLLFLQLIFFGFIRKAISIYKAFQIQGQLVLFSMGMTFLMIQNKFLSKVLFIIPFFIECSILIIFAAITMIIILQYIRHFDFLENFLIFLFSTFYVFYLILETNLIMCKGNLKLQNDDYLIGSFLLNALMIKPLVRILYIIYNALGRKNI